MQSSSTQPVRDDADDYMIGFSIGIPSALPWVLLGAGVVALAWRLARRRG